MGYNERKKFSAPRAQRKGTIESFLGKKGYSKVKMFFALRLQSKGTTESFLSKKGYNKVKILGTAHAKKGYNRKVSKQEKVQ